MVAQLISESIAKWGNGKVEAAVFGTAEPAVIADVVGRFCEQELRAPLRDGLFYAASVGCVIGVRLADQSEVVIKAYQPRWTAPFLSSVCAVQAHLADAGFPCPRPVAGPLMLGRARCLVETYLRDPGPVVIEPVMLAVSADALAEQVRVCRPLEGAGLRAHPLNAGGTGLYPEPHSPLFDFGATAAGAEWIDAYAVEAKRLRDDGDRDLVIAHTDWSAGNVRLAPQRVLAVYDWDSLALVPETAAVGQAAATWSSTAAPGEEAPSLTEIVDYVRGYEDARGRAFTRDEHRAIGAAAVWLLAYASRCEHAIDPDSKLHIRARPRLAADGAALLALADLLA